MPIVSQPALQCCLNNQYLSLLGQGMESQVATFHFVINISHDSSSGNTLLDCLHSYSLSLPLSFTVHSSLITGTTPLAMSIQLLCMATSSPCYSTLLLLLATISFSFPQFPCCLFSSIGTITLVLIGGESDTRLAAQ